MKESKQAEIDKFKLPMTLQPSDIEIIEKYGSHFNGYEEKIISLVVEGLAAQSESWLSAGLVIRTKIAGIIGHETSFVIAKYLNWNEYNIYTNSYLSLKIKDDFHIIFFKT